MELFGNKWSNISLPILDRFIDAYDGIADALFWHNMMRKHVKSVDMGCYAKTHV